MAAVRRAGGSAAATGLSSCVLACSAPGSQSPRLVTSRPHRADEPHPAERPQGPPGRASSRSSATIPTAAALTRDGRLPVDAVGRARDQRHPHRAREGQRTPGRVVQKIVMPGMSGGIAMDPTRNRAYVSGLPASPHADENPAAQRAGAGGRRHPRLHVHGPRAAGPSARGVIGVPPPSGTPRLSGLPAADRHRVVAAGTRDQRRRQDAAGGAEPRGFGGDRRHRDAGRCSYAAVGHYPYGAAIDRDGHGYVT